MSLTIWLVLALSLVAASAAFTRGSLHLRECREVAARFRGLTGADSMNAGWNEHALNVLERAGRTFLSRTHISNLQRQLFQAGYFSPSAPFVFTALRAVLALVLGGATCVFRARAYGLGPAAAVPALAMAWLGYRLAVTGLMIKAERRVRTVRRELPYVIDVVLLVLDSGVSIDQSLRYAAAVLKRTAPICTSVLARYVADIETGLAYEAALDRFGARLGIEEGADLASLVKQALFQGGELGPALRRFAADLMDVRLSAAREQIGRRSAQLTLVMLVFFMPVLFIVLGGPAVSQLGATLGHVARDMHGQDAGR